MYYIWFLICEKRVFIRSKMTWSIVNGHRIGRGLKATMAPNSFPHIPKPQFARGGGVFLSSTLDVSTRIILRYLLLMYDTLRILSTHFPWKVIMGNDKSFVSDIVSIVRNCLLDSYIFLYQEIRLNNLNLTKEYADSL